MGTTHSFLLVRRWTFFGGPLGDGLGAVGVARLPLSPVRCYVVTLAALTIPLHRGRIRLGFMLSHFGRAVNTADDIR